MSCIEYLRLLVRRRIEDIIESETVFHRCLQSLDVTVLGLGSMLGAGLYIATGAIARNTAGPAIVLSLLIAAVPVTISSLCYGEFGSRIGRTGSSYSYTYYSLGEVWAFLVGWNLILENTIAVALLGHEVSRFLDVICNGYIYRFFKENISNWHVRGFLPFPDFLAFIIIIVFTIISALGAKQTGSYIRIATLINILVILFVALAGVYYMDTKNWSTMHKFMPFGIHGVMTGAASSYFAYLGFDTLNTASEEAIDPKTTIPLGNNISTYAGVLVYLVIASVLTLMIPYNLLSPDTALPEAFAYENFPLGKYFVAVGGVFAMTTCLLTYLFSGARIAYAMANDGLIFEFFGKVHTKTRVPVRAVCVCGFTAATVALFVDVNNLVEMLSIGTLLAYTMVAIAVILDRYMPHTLEESLNEFSITVPVLRKDPPIDNNDNAGQDSNRGDGTNLFDCCPNLFKRKDNRTTNYNELPKTEDGIRKMKEPKTPTDQTYGVSCLACACLVVSVFGFCLAIPSNNSFILILVSSVMGMTSSASFVVLMVQPRRAPHTKFSVPYVPVVPLISVVINEYLLTNLSKITWASFAAWSFIGFAVYFIYGISHSKENNKEMDQKAFLLKYTQPMLSVRNRKTFSKSSDDMSPNSSTSSDDELISTMMFTSEDDKNSPWTSPDVKDKNHSSITSTS
ncbi:cationic amino acid transporter 4-like [Actinia tenebrosa]|uniref:Cationic amino acid transporter 4-like n=1 Tax=Actinia tenebrosa TaxID=6105 RepID=A0A6P8IPC7_ACTTE|nr:cationic amino acid transporter 4-like [Actinia tenebrosa]